RGRSFLRQLHRALELRWCLLDSEILRIKLLDLRHVVGSKRRAFRCFGEFNELFFVVNIRQRRSHTIVGEQPLQCRLSERALGIFKETQFLNLLDAVEQPTRSEEHTSELQSLAYLVCRLLLE